MSSITLIGGPLDGQDIEVDAPYPTITVCVLGDLGLLSAVYTMNRDGTASYSHTITPREASLEAQVANLQEAIIETFSPPLLALVEALDNTLSRWPWLYRKLGG